MGEGLKKKIRETLKFILDVILNIALLLIIVLVTRKYIVAPFQVYGPSMCNILNYFNEKCQDGYGEYIILKKFGYIFSEPERYDIVVFTPPSKEKTFYIKRIIGIPGDTVTIKDGKIFINDKELEEPYLNEKNKGNTRDFDMGKITVPDKSYFVLGDNRIQSTDARTCFENDSQGCEKEGRSHFISEKLIEGKAWVVLWPLEFMRVVQYPDQLLAEK